MFHFSRIRRLNFSNILSNPCRELTSIGSHRNLSLSHRRLRTGVKVSLINEDAKKLVESIVKKYVNNEKSDSMVKIISSEPNAKQLVQERLEILENLSNLKELSADKEMKSLVEEEQTTCKTRLEEIDAELFTCILENIDRYNCDDIILEVTTGVGGKEAMLFAKELIHMYMGYLDYLNYDYEIIEYDNDDMGGIRHSSIMISGSNAFLKLRHEAGVHRVQRVPATEKSGRIHTSTVSVSVLPQVSEIEVEILDKDLKIETKKASGAGGQHVNTTDSAVRITHLPTGIMVECQSDRSQIKNRNLALTKLRAKIYEQRLRQQHSSISEMRRKQMGMGLRNEKIRTYNYPQDRVTDHRIADGTLHNLKGFVEGGEALEGLQAKLQVQLRMDTLKEIINNLEKK